MSTIEEIDITLHTGKPVIAKKITVQSVFPYSREDVWQKIQTSKSLQFICRPWIYFEQQKGEVLKEQWRAGDTARLKLWVYGFLPFGRHDIFLERIDSQRYEIQSRETGNLVKVWDHLITMEELEPRKTKYTDEVIIFAGLLTTLIAWWSIGLYKHRQRRWLKLLAQ